MLSKLFDYNWTGSNLYYRLKHYKVENRNLFYKAIEKGLFYEIAKETHEDFFRNEILTLIEGYEEYAESPTYLKLDDPEYLVWYADDILEFFKFHKIGTKDKNLLEIERIITEAYAKEEADHNLQEEQDMAIDLSIYLLKLLDKYSKQNGLYFEDYSLEMQGKALMDRSLCHYVNELVEKIGYSGKELKKGKYDRKGLPDRFKTIILQRESFRCSNCNKDLTGKEAHFDHIIPLADGGTNDISNFQLLCKKCNHKKGRKRQPVKPSQKSHFNRSKT